MHLDFIGDVHGHADALEALLHRLGYAFRDGAWRHPGARRAVFVGDLVDRGPRQLDSIAIVRGMIEAGTAEIVMGNHEFNAIAFATEDPSAAGFHFRPRRGDNVDHHAVFLDAAGGADSALHRELVAFFRSMPLWLDLGVVRVVHACWSASSMATLAPYVDGHRRLTDDGLMAALSRGTEAFAACEIILKGPEMTLPDGVWYLDAQNIKRRKSRTRWWDRTATTIRSACAETQLADRLPDDPLPAASVHCLDASVPTFFGHYWITGTPFLLTPTCTCLDFSVAKGGVLCAYRFDGEQELDAAKLVYVP